MGLTIQRFFNTLQKDVIETILYSIEAGFTESELREEIITWNNITFAKAIDMATAKEKAKDLSFNKKYVK